MKRRQFLMGCSAGAALLASSQWQSLAYISEKTVSAEAPIFVLLFLRGGCDGLSLVAPVNDPNYIDARSIYLRVTDSSDNKGYSLQHSMAGLDFRFHSKAGALKELYDSNQLAILQACGLTNGTRSHFDAMDMMEKGIDNKKSTGEGWLARFLSTLSQADPLSAVASGNDLPVSLFGSNQAVSLNEVNEFNVPGDAPRFLSLLKNMYQGDTILDKTAQKTIETIKYVQGKIKRDANNQPLPYHPAPNAAYPRDWYAEQLSKSLATIAQLIKMEVGVQVATADFGGWDTHENQHYYFPLLVDALSRALLAFYNDLSAYQQRLTVLVISEFGRRLKGNKSFGTDHGYGNVMFALGGKVKGGKMYGKWPGLATEQLNNGVDLAVTTDYRSVLTEILLKVFQCKQTAMVFPGFQNYQPLGFV